MTKRPAFVFAMTLFSLFATIADRCIADDVPVPVATDSRIKTLVYNENDVYSLLTHYGYQSNIEFSPQEEIETISVGDRVGWQIIPAGRRVFVRAMEEFARTNMTVVTNRRAYQFDLKSTSSTTTPNEELVYVVRFFYPDDRKNRLAPMPYSDDIRPTAGVNVPMISPPVIPASISAPVVPAGSFNYNYTFTGPDRIAPTRIYDDGVNTYFKFPNTVSSPQIVMILPTGSEVPLPVSVSGDMLSVNQVSPRFSVRAGSDTITIYNEMLTRRSN